MKKSRAIVAAILVLCLCGCGTSNGFKANQNIVVNELTEVISPYYDEAYPYSEGYAVVGKQFDDQMKYNYIDLNGNLILDQWVDFADSFSDGLAVIGTQTELPAELIHRTQEDIYSFGYIDTNGKTVISQNYLGTIEFRPRPFYKGYAEINWIDCERLRTETLINSTWNNVINTNGEKQFEFDNLTSSYPVDEGGDFRVLKALWNWEKENYAEFNPWMHDYVQGEEFEALILHHQDTEKTILVNQSKEVLAEFEGLGFWIDDEKDYFRVYSENGLLVADKTGKTIMTGINDVEKGLSHHFVIGNIINDRMIYQITDIDGNLLTNEKYVFVYPLENHYIIMTPENRFGLLDEKGKEVVDFGDQLNSVTPLTVYVENQGNIKLPLVEVDIVDENYKTVNRLYDLSGKLLCQSEGGNFEAIHSELIGLYNDGNYKLLNLNGEIELELPYPGFGVIQSITQQEFDLILYDYDAQIRHYFEITQTKEGWQAKEIADSPIGEWYWNGDVENIIAHNEVSKINSAQSWMGDIELLDEKGNILVPMGENQAVSLIENGIYIVAKEATEEVLSYGQVDVNLKDMRLYCGDFVSDVYDELGQVSENRVAFKKDGKWGYLEIK